MSIISLSFYVFFFIIMLVYYILPGKFQWMWLFCVSVFYYSYNVSAAQTLIFVTFILFNWASSAYNNFETKAKKRIYVTTLVIDILYLATFKYSSFIFGILESIGLAPYRDIFNEVTMILGELEPPHISYFALIVIGYLTDVYWGKSAAQKNPCKMFLFCGYFPIMTSGPIVRYNQLEGQLFRETKIKFSYERVIRGLERVIWGIFKKLVISQRCAVIVNTIYGDYVVYSGIYIIIAVITYAFQIYTDFSGLMDIVLGFSECLGIELPENFNTPFFSRSIAEFWRRWHITLGAFLKDYVLFSLQRGKLYKKMRDFCKKHLGKDYKKKYNIPAYFAMMVSWFIIGLWHGGGWNYIFGVGLYMWLIIVLSEMLQPLFAKLISLLNINTECESYHLFQQIRTFFIYIYGLSFFRASSLREGFALWKSAFSTFNPWILFDESIYELGLDRREIGIMGMGLLLVLVVSYITVNSKMDIRDWLRKQNFVFRLIVFVTLFVCVIVLGRYGQEFNASDFIYGKF